MQNLSIWQMYKFNIQCAIQITSAFKVLKLIYHIQCFQNYLYNMLFGEKPRSLTTAEETLIASQKIITGIDRLNVSMENLSTSVSSRIDRVEVNRFKY